MVQILLSTWSLGGLNSIKIDSMSVDGHTPVQALQGPRVLYTVPFIHTSMHKSLIYLPSALSSFYVFIIAKPVIMSKEYFTKEIKSHMLLQPTNPCD